MFETIIENEISATAFLVCTLASLLLGVVIALGYMFRSQYSKSFVVTLALLPAIVQMVIMMVNGNIGVGVAVAGAFSLVRFRSVPGNAREIGSVFLSMAIGLATGMGFIWVAAIFTAIMVVFTVFYTVVGFGRAKSAEREVKITIPENIDYTNLFDDVFKEYTSFSELVKVRTVNMGSLFQLVYRVRLRDVNKTKEFLDTLRCRNGNLDIVCSLPAYGKEEL
ncbi:MAG: DUF4956 domain-containing protein [Ruminococcaceae bacterium]|nr:DUF4956 domain-containing protein [Oscillospiraceae bacterium]